MGTVTRYFHTIEYGGGDIFMEIIYGILIVGGVFMILWCLMGLLLSPVCGDHLSIHYRASNEAADMEQCVRGFIWLRETGLLKVDLTIIDVGLNEDARYRASALEQKHLFIHIIKDFPKEDGRIGGN